MSSDGGERPPLPRTLASRRCQTPLSNAAVKQTPSQVEMKGDNHSDVPAPSAPSGPWFGVLSAMSVFLIRLNVRAAGAAECFLTYKRCRSDPRPRLDPVTQPL